MNADQKKYVLLLMDGVHQTRNKQQLLAILAKVRHIIESIEVSE